MALPAPEETLMGVTQYTPRKKQAPIVPIRVERRAPPKVLNKPGTTEWVGTQRPTEQQTPEQTMTAQTVKPMSINAYVKKAYPKESDLWKSLPAEEAKALNKDPYGYLSTAAEAGAITDRGRERLAQYEKDYKQYVSSLNKANTQTKANVAGYNSSVKTYNQAIGYKTPAENKAIAERLLKKTQPKTVMA